jgi:hypothetical protein
MYPVPSGSFDSKGLKLQFLRWGIRELDCQQPAWAVDILNCNSVGMLPVPVALRFPRPSPSASIQYATGISAV